MPDIIEPATFADYFGPPVHTYSRAQAIEDGFLIDVTPTAREAGITFPTALTSAAWEDCVAWSAEDNKRKRTANDAAGRLWDVIWMCHLNMRHLRPGEETLKYRIVRVPRPGRGHMPRNVLLKAVCGPGDDGSPVLTIMLPGES